MATYAIIGFGCAGFHALEAIREADKTGVIHIYSEHTDPPYNPMLTTYYASNRLCYEGMFPFGDLADIAANYHAEIFSGTRVTALDADKRTLTLEDGTERAYDKILLATGARSFTPPIPIECPEAAVSMRTLDDARVLKRILEERPIKQAVVIGASMAGIKVAEVLHNNGAHVILADMAPYIFPLAAYPETAERIERKLTDDGVELRFRAGLAAVRKGGEMTASVEFSGGHPGQPRHRGAGYHGDIRPGHLRRRRLLRGLQSPERTVHDHRPVGQRRLSGAHRRGQYGRRAQRVPGEYPAQHHPFLPHGLHRLRRQPHHRRNRHL